MDALLELAPDTALRVGPDGVERAVPASALEVAIDGAANLWFTPGAAIALLWILWRRRSRYTMRAARL